MFYYNQKDYSSISYPSTAHPTATISTSGCGVVSTCIAINNLVGKELYTVKQMRDFAINNKARVAEGTDLNILLTALCKTVKGLSFTTTSDEEKLIKHLKTGATAIANQGNAYNVFSDSGHFVVCYRMSGENIEILDPYMYTSKYDKSPRSKRIVKKTTNGCIVSKSEINKATSDRSPAYYLISYKESSSKKETTSKAPTFKVGETYKLTTNVKVRTGAGTKYSQKKRSQLTADGKKHAVLGLYAVLEKGTAVTVQEVKNDGNDIWVKIPSGWICVYYKGDIYAK
jgi:hypothetical protein